MKLMRGLLIALAVLALLVITGALLLPQTFVVTRRVQVAAPVATVYALVDDPREWKRWAVWNQRDPDMQMSYSGPPRGAGAGWAWQSASEGNGSMRFTAAEPGRRVAYELRVADADAPSTGELLFEPANGGTRVHWTMHGDAGSSLLFRWAGVFADALIGPDFAAGLANLRAEAEKG
ncbi:MAG: SRPBCC family protein [Rubrivivax sp.]